MQVKVQQIYETLGISDIMRGSSKASETATAQKIKAQFGSVRLDYYQNELARWVRDALRIKAEIIAEHFQPETIIAMSNIQYTPDAPLANDAAALIKTLSKTQYRIKVDSDTMAAIDWDARKQEATDTENKRESTALARRYPEKRTPSKMIRDEAEIAQRPTLETKGSKLLKDAGIKIGYKRGGKVKRGAK